MSPDSEPQRLREPLGRPSRQEHLVLQSARGWTWWETHEDHGGTRVLPGARVGHRMHASWGEKTPEGWCVEKAQLNYDHLSTRRPRTLPHVAIK